MLMTALNICRLSPSPPSPPRTLRLRSRTSPLRRAESFKELKAMKKKSHLESRSMSIWMWNAGLRRCTWRLLKCQKRSDSERPRRNLIYLSLLYFFVGERGWTTAALYCRFVSRQVTHTFFNFFTSLCCMHAFSQSPSSRCYIRLTFTRIGPERRRCTRCRLNGREACGGTAGGD